MAWPEAVGVGIGAPPMPVPFGIHAHRDDTLMHVASLSGSQDIGSLERHICIVTETYPPEINGVSLTLAQLVKGLLALGHVVSLVRPRQHPFDTFGRYYDYRAILVRGVPLPGYKGLQFGLPAGRLLRNCWARHRPDVVYVATEGPLGWSAVCNTRRLGISVFSGFHTNYHAYSKHYRLGWLQNLVLRYLRTFHNRTSGTLVASGDLGIRLRELGFNNVNVLGRGVDNQRFTPERRCAELRTRWGLSNDGLAILYVGRLAPEKNVRLAIDAYRAIKRRNTAVKFILVGDGPIRTTLQREHPDLIFAGLQTGEELARHYASADVFLFPSETETFGNVTLEAMASGLVVIAYDYAAAKIHITHGETGLLVPYAESKTFIDTAARLVLAHHSLDRIRRQARQYATSIDWPRVVETFDSLLADDGGDCTAIFDNATNFGRMPKAERM
ncbi:MAG TPA: glycosyltransferase family 1 protein [Candidatus Binataceae bacterium]|nr:glycosyltransferase family 1 protein [Candidatus Binataceae bacterium]